jgi:hypothetical protein
MTSSSFLVSELTIQSKNMVCRLNEESVSLFLIRFNGESPEQEKGREEVSNFQDITRQKEKTSCHFRTDVKESVGTSNEEQEEQEL